MITNNTNDLMNQAGAALRHRDADTLLELLNLSEQWLQSDEERDAQLNVLTAMLEAVEELGEL